MNAARRPPGPVVALTGAGTALGRRVAAQLGGSPSDARVRRLRPADLRGEVKPRLEGVGAVVHLASASVPVDVDAARRLLEAAGAAGVPTVVVVTSALVYGAHESNPVPLTEAAPLAEDDPFAPAQALVEVERAAVELRAAHPATTVAVLRPVPAVGDDEPGWLASMLASVRGTPVADADPPGQFVHHDDLAAAVDLAVRRRLDGAYNVAPEGWIAGTDLRALAGGPRVALPDGVVHRLTSLRWRAGLSPAPPELLPRLAHPWVVASDALRAEGWTPTQTNEEAFVAGHRPAPWATVSPRRRQEVALAVTGATLVGAAATAATLLRRATRR